MISKKEKEYVEKYLVGLGQHGKKCRTGKKMWKGKPLKPPPEMERPVAQGGMCDNQKGDHGIVETKDGKCEYYIE